MWKAPRDTDFIQSKELYNFGKVMRLDLIRWFLLIYYCIYCFDTIKSTILTFKSEWETMKFMIKYLCSLKKKKTPKSFI